ncbi:MAG: glutamine synthetase beta-grasp domain-containing protein [Anaerolineae bacterium]|nr:glutamine synthetase beta-grasp domain-containing protein [Anaerolineae bacterium]
MRLLTCEAFDEGSLEADYLNLLLFDIGGGMRSVTLPQAYVSADVLRDGIGFDASNYGFAKVEQSDMVAVPDCNAAWLEERGGSAIAHVICDVVSADRSDFDQYPRAVAKRAATYLREQGIADSAQMLVELEYYAFDTVEYGAGVDHAFYKVGSREGLGEAFSTRHRFAPLAGYHRLPPEDRFFDFRNRTVSVMAQAGIPVKYHHHEVAASQLEIELDFMDLARAADSVCIAKWIIRSIAQEMGLAVTFMPKPLHKMPGSGMHVHQFLEKGGRSLFPGDALYGLSREGLAYTAGLLEHSLSGSLLAFTNPSTNSFRRLVPGYEAPIGATFARGSRNAAVRIPGYLKEDELRIEYRTGDGSANVHYMLSAMVLAGVDGILRNADPVALGFSGPEAREDKVFPLDLDVVLDGLARDSAWLKPAFPNALLALWTERKREEAAYVYHAPTPQEYELYF